MSSWRKIMEEAESFASHAETPRLKHSQIRVALDAISQPGQVRDALTVLDSSRSSSDLVFVNDGLRLGRRRAPAWLRNGSRRVLVWLGGVATAVLAGVLTALAVAQLHL